MPQTSAVLTGDLVGSTKAAPSSVDRSMTVLAQAITQVDWAGAQKFTRFRGDGWQVLLDHPRHALRLSLILIASLRGLGDAVQSRIAIGFGPVSSPGTQDLSDAAGPAFERAGEALDQMPRGRRLSVSDLGAPAGSRIAAPLLDALCRDWTLLQAEPLPQLLRPQPPTQASVAAGLSLSPQALNNRLQGAHLPEILDALALLENQPSGVDIAK